MQQNEITLTVSFLPLVYENHADVLVTIHNQADLASDCINKLETTKESTNLTQLTNLNMGNSQYLLSNLEPNNKYTANFTSMKNGVIKTLPSSLVGFETRQLKELHVSDLLYTKLVAWSSNEAQTEELPDYLLSIQSEVNFWELLAFVQHHYKVQKLKQGIVGNLPSYFEKWPIKMADDFARNPCNCSFVINTARLIAPGALIKLNLPFIGNIGNIAIASNPISYSGSPESTGYYLEGKGAAKRMRLAMSGKHGGGKYEASTLNLGSGTDAPIGLPFYSRISYNLFCSAYPTQLPAECMCEKPIKVDYSYTTKLQTKAEDGGGAWIFSAGAEAVVEDVAVLAVKNNGVTTIVDANRARAETHCSSNVNSTWWTNLTTLAVNTIFTATGTSPTQQQVQELSTSLISLISTPYFNSLGDCTPKNYHGTLIQGTRDFMMTPNKPFDVILSSGGYEFVRGYGKWYTKSYSVSDYHLTAILFGENKDKPECCTPKVGDFIIGHFDDLTVNLPGYGPYLVGDKSFHNRNELRNMATYLYNLWGPFDDLERDNAGNFIIPLWDWGHVIQPTPGCGTPIDPFGSGGNDDRSATLLDDDKLNIYPNPVTNLLEIQGDGLQTIEVIDQYGKVCLFERLPENQSKHELDLTQISSGAYFIRLTSKKEANSYKLIN